MQSEISAPREYCVSGYIEYARLEEAAPSAFIVLGILPDGSAALQEAALPPLETGLARKVYGLFSEYAEEISLTVAEESWEVGLAAQFTVSYMVRGGLKGMVTVAYKNHSGRLSERGRPTVFWRKASGPVHCYGLEEGVEMALDFVGSLSLEDAESRQDGAEAGGDKISLGDAIKSLEEGRCPDSHSQLAGWLKELLGLRGLKEKISPFCGTAKGYVCRLRQPRPGRGKDGTVSLEDGGIKAGTFHLSPSDYSKALDAHAEGRKISIKFLRAGANEGYDLEIAAE